MKQEQDLLQKRIDADQETARKHFAQERELAEDATWAEITGVDQEAARQRIAKERGLSEDASWKEITDAVLGV
jgi:hypothetical protein